MSQNIADKTDAAEVRTKETRGFMQQVRVTARRRYTPEEKVRIVLEGFRREVAIRDLCRRERIKPGAFYAWTKDFMEAGKERLTRDAVRDATRQEIEQIKRENTDLKHLVADLALDGYRLKKNGYSFTGEPQRRQRMSVVEKTAVVYRMEALSGRKRQALVGMGIPRSTYYRWRQEQRGDGLESHSGNRGKPWNRIIPEEEERILAVARESPELSSRQLATWITDNAGFAVSESTVYRILRKEGLVKRLEVQLVAGKEYHAKTTRPHQMWATDASYFRVVGWGYYYLVTVMDDYSRFILAWKLQRDMSANSLIEVIQEAVDATEMTEVPVEDRTRLLSDNGAGYVCRAFRDYLHLVGIRHILAAPYHPQTNGKLERYHQSIKREVNQVPYEFPSQLERAIANFVEYYNFHRYHKALGNVTPADVLHGRREEILQRRKEVQIQTINRRRDYNRGLRELANTA